MRDVHTTNLDESCMMASGGIIKVLGCAGKNKHENNISGYRFSVTTVRVGSAAGVDGPRVYLAKGERLKQTTMKRFGRGEHDHHPAPEGTFIEMTPNAYMTEQAWKNINPKLCKGMRKMKGVRDGLWMVLSMGGFGSHLKESALHIFSDHMIIVVKEEGDTSQVSQAYDQTVAKNNKKFTCEMLDKYKFHTTHVMNQWELILIINTALDSH